MNVSLLHSLTVVNEGKELDTLKFKFFGGSGRFSPGNVGPMRTSMLIGCVGIKVKVGVRGIG